MLLIFKMLFRSELLYFNILLIFSLSQIFARETFTASFTKDVTGNSETTKCEFFIRYTDSKILGNSKVNCGKVRKVMIVDFKYELKSSMHILRQAFKNRELSLLILKSFYFLFLPLFEQFAILDNFLKASLVLK